MLAGNLAGNPHSVCVEKNYKQIRSLYVYKRTDAYIYIYTCHMLHARKISQDLPQT